MKWLITGLRQKSIHLFEYIVSPLFQSAFYHRKGRGDSVILYLNVNKECATNMGRIFEQVGYIHGSQICIIFAIFKAILACDTLNDDGSQIRLFSPPPPPIIMKGYSDGSYLKISSGTPQPNSRGRANTPPPPYFD